MQMDDLGKLFQGNLFEHIQKAQQEVQKTQENLKSKYAEGSAGGGKVTAVVNGHQQLIKLRIDPEVIQSDPEEIELLEDMVVAAVNQAMTKSAEMVRQEMGSLTGGLDLQSLMGMLPK